MFKGTTRNKKLPNYIADATIIECQEPKSMVCHVCNICNSTTIFIETRREYFCQTCGEWFFREDLKAILKLVLRMTYGKTTETFMVFDKNCDNILGCSASKLGELVSMHHDMPFRIGKLLTGIHCELYVRGPRQQKGNLIPDRIVEKLRVLSTPYTNVGGSGSSRTIAELAEDMCRNPSEERQDSEDEEDSAAFEWPPEPFRSMTSLNAKGRLNYIRTIFFCNVLIGRTILVNSS
eukprot:Nk52_evm5s206 gene=Nk52_evmTU5s206